MKVAIQTIRVWELDVPKEQREDPIKWAYGLSVGEIETEGKMTDCSTDYAEVVDEDDEEEDDEPDDFDDLHQMPYSTGDR